MAARADSYGRMSLALCLSMPVLILVCGRYLEGVDLASQSGLYAGLAIVGYYGLILQLLLTVVFFLFAAWTRAAMVATGATLALALFWLVVDGTLYRVLRFHIDAFWLPVAATSSSALGISRSMQALAVAALAGAVALVWFLYWLAKRLPHRWRFVSAIMAVCLLAFVLSQALHILAYERNDTSITSITPRLPFYYPIHSHRQAAKYGSLLPMIKEGGTDPENAPSGSLVYPLPEFALASPPAARRPNILMLVLESWRADCMNETVSPRIQQLAQRAAVFKNHFSSGNCTTAGIFSLFYGIHSTYWTAVKANATQIDNPVLIDELAASGYTFGIFADSNFERHKIKNAVFRGIEVHEDFEGDTPDAKDRDLNNRLLDFARDAQAAGQPFFGFAFYKSTHFSYHYPPQAGRFTPAYKLNIIDPDVQRDRDAYFNDYRNAVYYTDQLIGELLDGLEAAGALANTMVIVTSDHGEEFDDNHANYWGHVGNFTGYQTRVPLVVYVPWQAPRQVESVTAHVDIVPTLLREGLGCDAAIGSYSNGYDLFGPLPAERPIIVSSYVNYAVVTGDDVFVVYPMYVQRHALWDLDAPAGRPRPDLARIAMQEMGSFYRTNALAAR